MPGFVTAAQARALYDRAQRAHPRRIDPELNARLIAGTNEQITAARSYATEMLEQRAFALAGYGFTEVARLEKLRDFYEGAQLTETVLNKTRAVATARIYSRQKEM